MVAKEATVQGEKGAKLEVAEDNGAALRKTVHSAKMEKFVMV